MTHPRRSARPPRWWFRAFSAASAAALAAVTSGVASAREVTITTTMGMANRGVGAYVIFYVTDAERTEYKGTLRAFGHSTRYYGQFRHWWRATEPVAKHRDREYDGKTGASLARGEVVSFTLDLPEDLFEGVYVIRVDSSVQEGRDVPSELVVPLRSEMSGVPVAGSGYIASVQVDM